MIALEIIFEMIKSNRNIKGLNIFHHNENEKYYIEGENNKLQNIKHLKLYIKY